MGTAESMSCVSAAETGTDVTSLSTPVSETVSIVVHNLNAELVLGPADYPSDVSVEQLQADLLATAFAHNKDANFVQLLRGERVLGENETIANGSQEKVSLSCIFSKGIYLSTTYTNHLGNWSLDVKPLSSGQGVDDWLCGINAFSETSDQIRGSNVKPVSGRDLLAHTKKLVSNRLQKEEWQRLEELMKDESCAKYLEMAISRGLYPQPVGFRASVAGHGITFLGEVVDSMAMQYHETRRLVI